MVKQAESQGKMMENKFTRMDKMMLNKFFNACKGLTAGLELRMDNAEEFEEKTYMILEFMERVNKLGIAALLDGHGDEFDQLMDVWEKHDFSDKEKSS